MINTVSRGLKQAEVINPVFTYSDQVKHPGNCSSGGVLISSADQPVVIETSGKRSYRERVRENDKRSRAKLSEKMSNLRFLTFYTFNESNLT